MKPLIVLDDLRIASRCQASWEAMPGDDRVRACDSCSKHVYNVSGMTAGEAVALIRESEGRVCLRLYRRRDGTVLTADCPVGIRFALRRRLIRLATAGVVMWAVLRLGIGLFADSGSEPERPAIPTGPGVTFSDWADWAAVAMGIKKPAPNTPPTCQVTLGRLSRPPRPSDGDRDSDEATAGHPFQL